MHPVARRALEKLYDRAERAASAGDLNRRVQFPLSEKTYPEYRQLRVLADKEAVDTAFRLAAAKKILDIDWPVDGGEGEFAIRLRLLDAEKLARHLGLRRNQEVLAEATELLAPWMTTHPILHQVIERWGALKTVRGKSAADAREFADAARVAEYMRGREDDVLMRVLSVTLFRDSKRLERLGAAIDAITADSLEAASRQAGEVFTELGIAKQPQPVLLAGNVGIRRQRGTSVPDMPYFGLPAQAIEGLADLPRYLLIVENLTSFHQIAGMISNESALAIYSGGMPPPSWRAMLDRVLASIADAQMLVFHWGDIDEGGFRIASVIGQVVRRHRTEFLPWLMSPTQVHTAIRNDVSQTTARRTAKYARMAGWQDLADEVQHVCVAIEQESIAPALPP